MVTLRSKSAPRKSKRLQEESTKIQKKTVEKAKKGLKPKKKAPAKRRGKNFDNYCEEVKEEPITPPSSRRGSRSSSPIIVRLSSSQPLNSLFRFLILDLLSSNTSMVEKTSASRRSSQKTMTGSRNRPSSSSSAQRGGSSAQTFNGEDIRSSGNTFWSITYTRTRIKRSFRRKTSG